MTITVALPEFRDGRTDEQIVRSLLRTHATDTVRVLLDRPLRADPRGPLIGQRRLEVGWLGDEEGRS